jgi:thioredoxin 1
MKHVIRFTASWCNPCKSMAKVLESIDSDVPIRVVDIDEDEETAKRYGIRSVPTLVMLYDGAELKRLVGLQPTKDLEKWLND